MRNLASHQRSCHLDQEGCRRTSCNSGPQGAEPWTRSPPEPGTQCAPTSPGPRTPPTSAPAERNWGHRGGAGGWSVLALRMLNEGREGPSHTEATAEGQVTTKGRLPLEGCPTMEDGHPQKRGQRLDRGQQLQGPSSAPSGRGCAVPPSGHLWAPPGARAGSRGAARSGHRKQPGPPPQPPPRPPRMLQTRSSCLRSQLGARARTDRSRIRSC